MISNNNEIIYNFELLLSSLSLLSKDAKEISPFDLLLGELIEKWIGEEIFEKLENEQQNNFLKFSINMVKYQVKLF